MTRTISKIMYRVMTSARPCNKVGHLFLFTILAQHETDDVILYIHSGFTGEDFLEINQSETRIVCCGHVC